MKSLFIPLLAILLVSTSLTAQYETTVYLYDTISEGPYIAPEKGGYNFIFKTRNIGNMVSVRGQVINPAVPYDMFNHYHIQQSGQVDSILAIPVRSEVSNSYTMYMKGAPKLLQFRVGTSNDPTIDLISSKYPLINKPYNNDESHTASYVVISDEAPFKYSLINENYNKGVAKRNEIKAIVDIESDWLKKGEVTDPSTSIIALGKVINGDNNLKFNDQREFKFLALNQDGEVKHEEDIIFEKSYIFANSGIVQDISGSRVGFYISLVESSEKKANEDYNAAANKILFFDDQGKYLKETTLILPFEPKAKEVGDQRILSIVNMGENHRVYIETKGNKKAKIAEGIYTFQSAGDQYAEVDYRKSIDLEVVQDLRNKPLEEVFFSSNFNHSFKLDNGNLTIIASEDGKAIRILNIDDRGSLENTASTYLAGDIIGSHSELKFENLNSNSFLITSKIGSEKSVHTSYSVFNSKSGKLRTIQPNVQVSNIQTIRNGNDIIVHGQYTEDPLQHAFLLEKLVISTEGVSMRTK